MRKKIIIAIAVVVLAVISMLNINNTSNTNKEALAITETENAEINFIIEDDVNIDIANLYKKNESELPETMRKYVTSIVITNENLGDKFDMNLDANILAITYGSDIYISDKKYNENVLIHEMFHVYDYSNNWISTSDDFMKIYNKEKDLISVSDGNAQNVYEFWASAGEMYYFNRDELKNTAPLTYKFFVENIPF